MRSPLRAGDTQYARLTLLTVGYTLSTINAVLFMKTVFCFVLWCSFAGALVPTARFLGSGRRKVMSELRRRHGGGSKGASSSSRDDVIGLFWKRDVSKKDGKGSAAFERNGSSGSPISSSVIHLGRLRIPDCRRVDLCGTSLPSAEVIAPPVVDEHAAAIVDAEKKRDDERSERRLIEVGNRVVLPPTSVGGPSVMPFGVGEDTQQSGVVQIPLYFTVGQTVDFIRTVATIDRDYRMSDPAAMEPMVPVGEMESGECMVEAGRELGSSLSSRIYVTDDGTLKGYITMAMLLTHQPDTPVAELLRELDETLHEGDSWEDAAARLRQAKVMAAPVVDSEGNLVAVLNPADLLQEMEIAATDDVMRLSGSGGGESYFGTPLTRLVVSRVGWLVSLLCLQSFSSLILQSFQSVIERNIVIALFLTMLTGTAGNAGNQSSAIVIRGLATGEINQSNKGRVIWREARAGAASAVVLSMASFVRVLLTPGATTVATLAVSVAMGMTVVGAVMFGTIAPIVLHGMGVDPVNFASPALATLTDVSGVFILCSVAKMMLGGT